MSFESISRQVNNWQRKSGSSLWPVQAILLALLLSACNGPAPATESPNEDALGTMVAETMAAVPTQEASRPTLLPTEEPRASATPTSTPEATSPPTPSATIPANNVSGRICFPGGETPAMVAYFEETETETITELAIADGQTSYEVNLAPGTYIAYAWLPDFSRGGLYSRVVVCGMTANCNDHSLQPFLLNRAEVISGIDLCDWQAGPFNVPYPPGKSKSELTGNISGNISYFGGSPPGLRVVAFNQGTRYWYWVSTMAGQASFIIPELPAGTYHLVAYDEEGRAGGHADANHNLIAVVVNAGETTSGAHVEDWNAPPGSFPEDPTR